jgi:hypothetical protein
LDDLENPDFAPRSPEIVAARAAATDALGRLGRAAAAWPPSKRTKVARFAAAVSALRDVERWLAALHNLRAVDPLEVASISPDPVSLADAAGWAHACAAELAEWCRTDAATAGARGLVAARKRSSDAQVRARAAGVRSAATAGERSQRDWDEKQAAIVAEARRMDEYSMAEWLAITTAENAVLLASTRKDASAETIAAAAEINRDRKVRLPGDDER